jgi:nucleoside 2-deoxyribosyltransferase
MKNPRLYIAGPMTGYAYFNFPLFHTIARYLRKRGYKVSNPAEKESDQHGLPDMSLIPPEWGGSNQLSSPGSIRTEDFHMVLQADAVVALPEWEQSWGAKLEVAVALACGKPVFVIDEDGGLRVLEVALTVDVVASNYFGRSFDEQEGA